MMKKKVLVTMAACVLLVGILIFIRYTAGSRKPFRELEPSEIISATVTLTPPDKTIQITEIKELTDRLRDVVIHQQDNSYTGYSGQGVTFTLTMADGTRTDIMAYNPFLVIDGVGYRTEYGPCQALSAYANRLLQDEDAVVILEEPPRLAVICDEMAMGALRGSYSWQKRNSDGTSTATEADSAHPLDREDLFPAFEVVGTTATLRFTEDPDEILSIRCWSEDHWGDPEADSESVTADGYEIELKPGGTIYEVIAEWGTEKSGYGGVAHYSFYINREVDQKD